jgi:hypothetical protein
VEAYKPKYCVNVSQKFFFMQFAAFSSAAVSSFQQMKARIYKSTGSWYIAKAETGKMYNARIKGVFKIGGLTSTNPIAVGDEVDMQIEDVL